MKNRKQLLADFYLELLEQPADFHRKYFVLFGEVKRALAMELESDSDTVERIFTRMAAEDR